MILNYLNPLKAYSSLSECIEDLYNFSKYKEIVQTLYSSGKLEDIGFSLDQDANLYLGVNLNPELLMYSETSQTSVELKMISEKMNKYTDFLTREGIIDYTKLEYDRVKTDDFYGYVLQVSYNFKKYRLKKLIYAISYFTILLSGLFYWITYLLS